ncbi:probable glutathione S-transferase [Benincasa hispida]|uniref:probable glutathione S-transferase n=1 Tax=Benincasa hispida TaxID=102211 RepID=UPI001901B673|nr:probable glutathione S-transferase [Benincasa hispida]
MAEVKLHGTWPSPFSYRVIWALALKSIPYEYIEEDLANKSPLLLQYNPVHKKIPVLVHGGNPICESMIILEYIDETWPQNPLLPSDPYERATARFWIKFIEDKGPAVFMVFRAKNEEEGEDAKKQSLEMLATVEEWGFGGGERKFFGGDEIGMADLAFGGIAYWLGRIEQVTGVKLLNAEDFPRVYAWAERFREAPVIRDNLPDWNLMAANFRRRRKQLLQSAEDN